MNVEICVESDEWSCLDLVALVRGVGAAITGHLQLPPKASAVLMACDDARIEELNRDFRGKGQPTNVLSWPAVELIPPALPAPDPGGEIELGDIALAHETCRREAKEQGKPFEDHVAHLIIHGILHLLGYDHIRDTDATLMEGLEVEILGKLGLPDPYR